MNRAVLFFQLIAGLENYLDSYQYSSRNCTVHVLRIRIRGSDAFFTLDPGLGLVFSRYQIRDPTHISENLKQFFGFKILRFCHLTKIFICTCTKIQ
jgi:hypothetical protein